MAEQRRVVDQLSEIYSLDETRRWLRAKYSMLGGERAIDLVHRGETKAMLGVIATLQSHILK